MAIHIKTFGDWMEKFFGGEEVGNVAERGYRLRVALGGYRVTPRDEEFEYFRDMGNEFLEPILHHKPIGRDHLALVYPERWLSVHEQHMLIYNLDNHPDVKSKTLTAVDILTQNPLIIGGLKNKEVVLFDMKKSRGLREDELHAVAEGRINVNQVYEMLSKSEG